VGAGWLVSSPAVPIYDGVNFPDDPYVSAPAAKAVNGVVAVSGTTTAAVQLKTPETGPQVLLDVGVGAFVATAPSVTVAATPTTADVQPDRGTVDGNVYRITATAADGSPVTVHAQNAQGFIFLRAKVMTRPDPVIVHRAAAGQPWKRMTTTRAGTDILSTPFRALGDYAVVRLPGSAPLGKAGGLSLSRVLLLGGGVVLLIVVTVLALRRSRSEE